MKTNPFDDSLRKKLVEVQPEFKEQDWENFQNYVRSQKAFNRTTQIWKQSKFWVGMAAASLLLTLSGICALLYQQNQLLKDELITLKEVLTRQPSANTPTRTDNLVPDETPVPLKNQLKLNQAGSIPKSVLLENQPQSIIATSILSNGSVPTTSTENQVEQVTNILEEEIKEIEKTGTIGQIPVRTTFNPINLNGNSIKKNTLISAKNSNRELKKLAINRSSALHNEKTAVILTDKVRAPYRLGVVASWTRSANSFGILNEVMLNQKFLATWGLIKTEFNDVYFSNEKTYTELTKHNFRKIIGYGIPIGSYVSNISTKSTVMQIPLTLGYRHILADNFAITARIGTQLNLRHRQKLQCDLWDGHKPLRITGVQNHNANYPMLNNINYSLGIEKSFTPIVLQGELFYHHQNKELPYLKATSPGIRVKLLYELGN